MSRKKTKTTGSKNQSRSQSFKNSDPASKPQYTTTTGLKTMEGIMDVKLYNDDDQPYPTSRVIKRDMNGNVVVEEIIEEQSHLTHGQRAQSLSIGSKPGSSKLYDSHWESLSPSEKKDILRIQKDEVFEVLRIFQNKQSSLENSNGEEPTASLSDNTASSVSHQHQEDDCHAKHNHNQHHGNHHHHHHHHHHHQSCSSGSTCNVQTEHASDDCEAKQDEVQNTITHKPNTVEQSQPHFGHSSISDQEQHNNGSNQHTSSCNCCGRRNVAIEEDLQDIYNYLYIQEKIKQPDLSHVLFHLNLVKDINNKISSAGIIPMEKKRVNSQSFDTQSDFSNSIPPPSYKLSVENQEKEDASKLQRNENIVQNHEFDSYRQKFEEFAKQFISGHDQVNKELTNKIAQFPQIEMLARDLCENGGKAFLKQVNLNKHDMDLFGKAQSGSESDEVATTTSKQKKDKQSETKFSPELTFQQFSSIVNVLGDKVEQTDFSSHFLSDDAKNVLKNLGNKVMNYQSSSQSQISEEVLDSNEGFENKNSENTSNKSLEHDVNFEMTQKDLQKLNLQKQMNNEPSVGSAVLNSTETKGGLLPLKEEMARYYEHKGYFKNNRFVEESEEYYDEDEAQQDFYNEKNNATEGEEDEDGEDNYNEEFEEEGENDDEDDDDDDDDDYYYDEEEEDEDDEDEETHHDSRGVYNTHHHEYSVKDEEDGEIDEEKRIEEGKKLIQIAITKILQKKLVSSYKEKQAESSRMTLLEELEREELKKKERDEKKAKKREKEKERKKQMQLMKEKELEQKKLNEEKHKKEAEEKEMKRREEQRKKVEEIKRKKDEAMRKKIEEQRKREEEEARQKKLKEEVKKKKDEERKQRDLEKKLERERKLEEQKKKQEERLEKERLEKLKMEQQQEIEKQKQYMLAKLNETVEVTRKKAAAFPYALPGDDSGSYSSTGDLLDYLQKPRAASTSLANSVSTNPTLLTSPNGGHSSLQQVLNEKSTSPLGATPPPPSNSTISNIGLASDANAGLNSNFSSSFGNKNLLSSFYNSSSRGGSISAVTTEDSNFHMNLDQYSSRNSTNLGISNNFQNSNANSSLDNQFMAPPGMSQLENNNNNNIYASSKNNISTFNSEYSVHSGLVNKPLLQSSHNTPNIGGYPAEHLEGHIVSESSVAVDQFQNHLLNNRKSIWSNNELPNNGFATPTPSSSSVSNINHAPFSNTNNGGLLSLGNSILQTSVNGPPSSSDSNVPKDSSTENLSYTVSHAYMQITASGNETHIPVELLYKTVSELDGPNRFTYSLFIKQLLSMCTTHNLQLLNDDKGTITHVWWDRKTKPSFTIPVTSNNGFIGGLENHTPQNSNPQNVYSQPQRGEFSNSFYESRMGGGLRNMNETGGIIMSTANNIGNFGPVDMNSMGMNGLTTSNSLNDMAPIGYSTSNNSIMPLSTSNSNDINTNGLYAGISYNLHDSNLGSHGLSSSANESFNVVHDSSPSSMSAHNPSYTFGVNPNIWG